MSTIVIRRLRAPALRRHPALLLTILTAAVLVALLSPGAAPAMLLKMNVDELTDASETVVVAKAMDTHSRWTDPDGTTISTKGTIVTDVRLAVYDVLKGEAQRTLDITVPGGSVGRVSIPITDAPRFTVGQMYVVFLNSSGQVVAWREGQPQLVGCDVPALHMSLSRLESRVAARTGQKTQMLRPWSRTAPTPKLAAPGPANSGGPVGSALTGSAAMNAGPTRSNAAALDGTGSATVPESAGAGSASLPETVTMQGDTAVGRTARGAATTLFWDDYESLNMNKWTLLYKTPVVVNECYFSNSFWEDSYGYDYLYAYSAAQRADYYLSDMWFWAFQYPVPGMSYYGNGDSTWMINKYAINTSAYPYGVLNFDVWMHTADANDQLGVYFSTDGTNFSGPYWYGDEGQDGDPPSFASYSIDLRNVPVPGGTQNFCSRPQIWVGFYFHSDGSGQSMGACVDNVEMIGSTTPIPQISNITPASAPAGTYNIPSRNQSRITISGSGFGSAQGNVAFFYQDGKDLMPGIVQSWTDTTITCDVPIGIIDNYPGSAGSGPVYVVAADGTWSGGHYLDVPFSYGAQYWEAALCRYRLNTGSMPSGAAAAIEAAAAAWNGAASGFEFKNVGTCSTVPSGAGENIRMPVDGHNDMCFAPATALTGVIAFASPIEVDGRILEVDIVFNSDGGFGWGTNGSGSVMDVGTIAAHEMGHWLQLRDLYGPGDGERVMYGFCGEGVLKRSLTPGETAGIQWIYTGAQKDTKGPVMQARSTSVRRGRTAKIKYVINDPVPSIGIGTAKIAIKNRAGRTVKKTKQMVYTRFVYTWSFKCKLAKGRYKIVVTGTDQLGHKQTKSVKGTLTVK